MSKPKVIIGSNYHPFRFERRQDGSYSALRPEPSSDDLRIQRALIARPLVDLTHRVDPEKIIGYTIATCAGFLMVLTAVGVIR